ncbi:MAG: cell division protein FtsL [Erysipelotrichaceae bacterium]|nr:cell division protein FtsL [Erysipelotrichaceae bacterium]
MRRVVKRRKLRLDNISICIFIITAILYLFTSVGLRSYNSYLNVTKQKLQNEIAALQKDNEVAQMEVNELSTYDRIMQIAQQDGMKSYNSNIITVKGNE